MASVRYVYDNGCYDSLNISVINCDYINLFPNPAKNEVIIQVDVASGKIFMLMNVLGQMVVQQSLSEQLNKLNIQNIPKGIYEALVYQSDNLIFKTLLVKD